MITIFYPRKNTFFIPYYWHAPKIDVQYWCGAAAVEYSGYDLCQGYDSVRFEPADDKEIISRPVYIWTKASSVRKFFENFSARQFELVVPADSGCKLGREFRIDDDGQQQTFRFHAVDRQAALIIAVRASNGNTGLFTEYIDAKKVGESVSWGDSCETIDILDPELWR